ncbi:MAG TPA: archease [Burkholderiaceae bacterium]|nr:archease [Burkholderiaceae bacterium]HQR71048.1 archease [Burkholderiaceae bacterium]
MPAGLPRYDYFDHDADTGVIGRGATLQDAFVHAAEATFALMCDPLSVTQRDRIDVEFDEDDPEIALVTWINLLLAHANERGLALGCFELAKDHARWHGSAWGEPWRADMERGTQVKGATLTGLSVKPQGAGWEARCVVDL